MFAKKTLNSRMGSDPRNLRKFSPSKVSRYTGMLHGGMQSCLECLSMVSSQECGASTAYAAKPVSWLLDSHHNVIDRMYVYTHMQS